MSFANFANFVNFANFAEACSDMKPSEQAGDGLRRVSPFAGVSQRFGFSAQSSRYP